MLPIDIAWNGAGVFNIVWPLILPIEVNLDQNQFSQKPSFEASPLQRVCDDARLEIYGKLAELPRGG